MERKLPRGGGLYINHSRIRKPQTNFAVKTHSPTSGTQHDTNVVGANLSNSPISSIELNREVALLEESTFPSHLSPRNNSSTIRSQRSVIQRNLLVHEDDKPSRIGKIPKGMPVVGLEDVSVGRGSAIALLVDEEDNPESIRTSGSSDSVELWKSEPVPPVDGLDRTLPPNSCRFSHPLSDYVNRRGYGAASGDHSIVQINIMELEFPTTSREPAIKATNTVPPRSEGSPSLLGPYIRPTNQSHSPRWGHSGVKVTSLSF